MSKMKVVRKTDWGVSTTPTTRKQSYRQPVLSRLGDIRDVTLGTTGTKPEGVDSFFA